MFAGVITKHTRLSHKKISYVTITHTHTNKKRRRKGSVRVLFCSCLATPLFSLARSLSALGHVLDRSRRHVLFCTAPYTPSQDKNTQADTRRGVCGCVMRSLPGESLTRATLYSAFFLSSVNPKAAGSVAKQQDMSRARYFPVVFFFFGVFVSRVTTS